MAVVLAAGVCTAAGCGGGSVHAGDVVIAGAWSRPSPPGAHVGVMYLTLTSPHADRLLEVRVPASVAARAELHVTLTDAAGRMSMQRVAAVDLPARRTLEFRPGGRHIMLMDLAKPLARGDTLDVALRFERAGLERARVPVRDE